MPSMYYREYAAVMNQMFLFFTSGLTDVVVVLLDSVSRVTSCLTEFVDTLDSTMSTRPAVGPRDFCPRRQRLEGMFRQRLSGYVCQRAVSEVFLTGREMVERFGFVVSHVVRLRRFDFVLGFFGRRMVRVAIDLEIVGVDFLNNTRNTTRFGVPSNVVPDVKIRFG